MRWSIIFYFLGVVGLFVLEQAWLRALPGGAYLNLTLVILIFILVLFGLERALPWWLAAGFLNDLFSFHYFGFYTLLFLVIALSTYFLLNNVLTNRSLYVFLFLTAAASLIFDLANYLVFALPWSDFLMEELKRLGGNFLATIVIFYLVGWLSYRLRPVFLIRHNK